MLVSLLTKRRLLIDGPDSVIGTGVYGATDAKTYFENMKDLVDRVIAAPSIADLEKLKAAGASLLVVDRQRVPNTRIDWFTAAAIRNKWCSVHVLDIGDR